MRVFHVVGCKLLLGFLLFIIFGPATPQLSRRCEKKPTMTIEQSQTVSLGECTLPPTMYPSEEYSLLFALSVDVGDDYYDDQMAMIDDSCSFEEADVDSLSSAEEILSILDRAIAVCDDIGLDDDTPLDNQQQYQTIQTTSTQGVGATAGVLPPADRKTGPAPLEQ